MCRRIRFFIGRLYANERHHAIVFMLEKMAVIYKGSYSIGIAEVHAQTDAGVLQRSFIEIRDINRVSKERLIDWYAGPV